MTDLFSIFAVVAIGIGAAQIARLSKQVAAAPGDWITVVREHADFRAQVSTLEPALAALRGEYDWLRDEQCRLSDELCKASAALDMESEPEIELRSELADLRVENGGLQAKLDALVQGRETAAELRSKFVDLQVENGGLQAQLNAQVQVRESVERLRSDLAAVRSENDALRGKPNLVGRGEAELRSELLGLDGALGRVVFVLDRSGSMDVKDNRTGRNRWLDAISTIDTWLRYLPVDEAALVVFSGGVDVYPPDGRWVPVRQEGTGALVDGLKDLSPMGATNTLEALRRAYRYPGVEVVILFTDGAPDTGKDAGVGTADDVYFFVSNQKAAGSKVRIHTVGIGDYFSPRMRDFLLRLSGETGGTFIGR